MVYVQANVAGASKRVLRLNGHAHERAVPFALEVSTPDAIEAPVCEVDAHDVGARRWAA